MSELTQAQRGAIERAYDAFGTQTPAQRDFERVWFEQGFLAGLRYQDEPSEAVQRRYLTDAEFHVRVDAARFQTKRDGTEVDAGLVCVILDALDRSGVPDPLDEVSDEEVEAAMGVIVREVVRRDPAVTWEDTARAALNAAKASREVRGDG